MRFLGIEASHKLTLHRGGTFEARQNEKKIPYISA
jgi:hypothetical protein